jgi:benzoylformate decarboxylase
MDLLRQYVYHEPARAIPAHIRLVHLDEDPYQLGKNYPLEVGVLGSIKESLAELEMILKRTMTPAQVASAARRATLHGRQVEDARRELWERAGSEFAIRPMSSLAVMAALARVLPNDIAVVEEAVTTTNTVFERLGALKNTSGYFGHRGWGLGWGLGCAIGVQLAWPERPVLSLLGEGAAMYGIQGLWSAAHYQIPVTFVIMNNAQYQILKIGAGGLKLPHAGSGEFVGLDLTSPEIDFVSLAQSLGVRAERVESPEHLADAVSESFSGDEPRLIDVPIDRRTPGRLEYG